VAFALLTFANSYFLLTLALVVLGLGFGLAVPGYTAAPTLLVGGEEQCGAAGLISATNGLAFVLGPLFGTALYGLRPDYPYIVGAAVLLLVSAFAYVHPRVRRMRKP
jgi:DHA1 family tetracycline resistance protein-like MFS transporter